MPDGYTTLPATAADQDVPRPGELRFASAVPPDVVAGPGVARLLLVVEVDADAGFVSAMLTTNETEMAGDTDAVLPGEQLGLPFPLCFESDLVGTLWISQLEPRIGMLPEETVHALLELRQGSHVPQLLPYLGLPLHDRADPRWQFKLAELAAMQALSGACTASLIDSEHIEISPILDELGSAAALRTLVSRDDDVGPLSLREVAEWTGLPQATLGKAVSVLLEQGFLLADRDEPESLRINENRPSAIGVSIRSNEVVGVITNLRAADLVPVMRRPLPSTEVPAIVGAIKGLVQDLLDGLPNESEAVIGLGVELSGHIDGRYGEVVFSPDLKSSGDYWRRVYLADLLQEATGLRTVVENDANALALHEQWFGDGINVDNFAVVLIGDRGIGCGLVIDGALVHGSEGIAGEIGHLVMDPDGPPCRCENSGCLETIASPMGICDATGAASGRRPADLLATATRVSEGDVHAIAAVERAGEVLGRGLSMVLNLINPSHVILFGPRQLTDPDKEHRSAELFMRSLEGAVDRYSFSFAAWQHQLIAKAVDGELGPRGAASAVLNRIMTGPSYGSSPRMLSPDRA